MNTSIESFRVCNDCLLHAKIEADCRDCMNLPSDSEGVFDDDFNGTYADPEWDDE